MRLGPIELQDGPVIETNRHDGTQRHKQTPQLTEQRGNTRYLPKTQPIRKEAANGRVSNMDMTADVAGELFGALADEIEALGLPRDLLMQMPTSWIIGFCMVDDAAKRRVVDRVRQLELNQE